VQLTDEPQNQRSDLLTQVSSYLSLHPITCLLRCPWLLLSCLVETADVLLLVRLNADAIPRLIPFNNHPLPIPTPYHPCQLTSLATFVNDFPRLQRYNNIPMYQFRVTISQNKVNTASSALLNATAMW